MSAEIVPILIALAILPLAFILGRHIPRWGRLLVLASAVAYFGISAWFAEPTWRDRYLVAAIVLAVIAMIATYRDPKP